jgi:hypothetical protein
MPNWPRPSSLSKMKREVMSTIGFPNIDPILLVNREFVKDEEEFGFPKEDGSGGGAAGGLEGPSVIGMSYVAALVKQRPMID